ncbi:MAG: calcium-binding protein [Acidimicrobiales bacterium]
MRSMTDRRNRVLAAVVAVATIGLVPTHAGADYLPALPDVEAVAVYGLGDFDGDGTIEGAMTVEDVVLTVDPATMTGYEVHEVGDGPEVIGHDGTSRTATVGDLDGDGRDDLIGRPFGTWWWRGLADGTFDGSQFLDFGFTVLLAAGDFAGDGADEVMQFGVPSGTSTIMRFLEPVGPGEDQWSSVDAPELGWRSEWAEFLVAGDFAAEPAAQPAKDEAAVLYRNGPDLWIVVFDEIDGDWTARRVLVTPWDHDAIRKVSTGDFDGDGDDDIAFLQEPSPNSTQLYVMLSDGAGRFGTPELVWEREGWDGDATQFFGSVDINRDGYEDLIGIHGVRPVRFFGAEDGLITFDPPVVEPPLCNGLAVTVDLRFGDEPTDGHDVILGTDGPDHIRAGGGDDTICGLGGRDRILGGPGSDWIAGGGGRDRLVGGPGRDWLIGGGGPDRLVGGPGRDRLFGNRGNDVLRGGPGNDVLVGAAGRNRCDGGAGRDRLGRGC